MTARKQKIAIGTVCTIVGVVGGGFATSVRATFAARAYAREFVAETAEGIAAPIRRDLNGHLKDVARDVPVMHLSVYQITGALEVLCEAQPRPTSTKCLSRLHYQPEPGTPP